MARSCQSCRGGWARLSAVLGTVMMFGLIRTLPETTDVIPDLATQPEVTHGHTVALCRLSATVVLVLAGFELGIVLQGLQHNDMGARQVALMFAECSLAMLGQERCLASLGKALLA